MLTAPFVLVAALAIVIGPTPEPEESWDEAEAEEKARAEEEAEAEAEAEPPPSPPPPAAASPQDVRYEMSPVPIPKYRGDGMLISAGILGAIGWGVMGWRMGLIKNGCRPDELDNNPDVTVEEAADTFDTALGCAGAEVVSTLAYILQETSGAVNWGLAPAGGAKRGKWDAAKFVQEGKPARKDKVWIGVGAGLLAAGLIGRLTVAAVRWDGIINPERGAVGRCITASDALVREVFDCYARRRQLHFFGQQFTSSVVAAGGGVLAYGIANRKWKKRYYKDYKEEKPEKVSFQFAPQVGLDYTGMHAALRF
jgi:hypothetical protein